MKYSDFYKSLIKDAIAMGKPLVGAFELTSRCNLRCKMCYICNQDDSKSLISKELSAKQWIEMGRQASDAGVLYLLLTGGEIFIRKDFFEIYEALTQMGFLISIYTNASLINDDIVQRLAKIPPYKISITVYGASPDTYGKVTGHPEAYEKVIGNIRKLVEAGINTELKTTVVKYNKGEYEQLAKLSLSMGLSIGIVNYISPQRVGVETDPLACRLEPHELIEYEKNADESAKVLYKELWEEKERQKNTSPIINDDMSGDFLSTDAIDDYMKSDKITTFRCAVGKYSFWISWDGKMLPCGMLDDIYSEALKDGFIKAWNELLEKCRCVPSCAECENCSYYSKCPICPARRKAETGSFEKAAPYICEYAKAVR